MVVKRQCSFCAGEIEPGTGLMFVKRDGTVFHFCSGSCRKQQLGLGRVGHRVRWTRAHTLKREQVTASAPAGPTAPGPASAKTPPIAATRSRAGTGGKPSASTKGEPAVAASSQPSESPAGTSSTTSAPASPATATGTPRKARSPKPKPAEPKSE